MTRKRFFYRSPISEENLPGFSGKPRGTPVNQEGERDMACLGDKSSRGMRGATS